MSSNGSSSSRSANSAPGGSPRKEGDSGAHPRRDPLLGLGGGGGGVPDEGSSLAEVRRSGSTSGGSHLTSSQGLRSSPTQGRSGISASGENIYPTNGAYSPTLSIPQSRVEGSGVVFPSSHSSHVEYSSGAGAAAASGSSRRILNRDNSPRVGVKGSGNLTPREGGSLIRAHSSNDLLHRRPAAGEVFEPGGWMGEGPPPAPQTKRPTSSASALGIPTHGRISATNPATGKGVAHRPPISPSLNSTSALQGGGLSTEPAPGRGHVRLLPTSSGESGNNSTMVSGGLHPLNSLSGIAPVSGGYPTPSMINNGPYGTYGFHNGEGYTLGKPPLSSGPQPAYGKAGYGSGGGGGLSSGFSVTLTSTGTTSTGSIGSHSTASSSRAPKPEWLNAAQRVKVGVDGNTGGASVTGSRSRLESVLPPEQNLTYGLQRHSSRGITEAQLRELVDQQSQAAAAAYRGNPGGGGSSMDVYGGNFMSAGSRRTPSAKGIGGRGISASLGRQATRSKAASPTDNGNSASFPISSNSSVVGNLPARLVMEEVAYSAKQQHFQSGSGPVIHHGGEGLFLAKQSTAVYSSSSEGKSELVPGSYRRITPSVVSSHGGASGHTFPSSASSVTDVGSGKGNGKFPLAFFGENGMGRGGPGNALSAGAVQQSPTRRSPVLPTSLDKSGSGLAPHNAPTPLPLSSTFGEGTDSYVGGISGAALSPSAVAGETAWWNAAYSGSDVGKSSSTSLSKGSLTSLSIEKSSSYLTQGNLKNSSPTSAGSYCMPCNVDGAVNGQVGGTVEGSGMIGDYSKPRVVGGSVGGVMINDVNGKPLPWMGGGGNNGTVGPGSRVYPSPTSIGPDSLPEEFGPSPSATIPSEGSGVVRQAKGFGAPVSGGVPSWVMASKPGLTVSTAGKSVYEIPTDGGLKTVKSSASTSGFNEQGGGGTHGYGFQKSVSGIRQRNLGDPSFFAEDPSHPSSIFSPNDGKGGGRGNDGKKKKEEKEKKKKAAEPEPKTTKYTSPADREERNLQSRDFNALHAIPWEQREQMPMSGFGTRFFSLLATPRFWEKMDWTFRGSLLTVVPTMILSLNPSTKALIPVPSSFAFMAFWVTMPTFGSGLRETVMLCKGFVFSGILLLLLIWGIHPGPAWLSLIFLFLFTVFFSFVGDAFKKNTAYLFTSTLMEYINSPSTGLSYMLKWYATTAASLCFGIAAFIIPFIRWSSEHARHYTHVWGNALSIGVQGTCSSFWVEKPIERELNLSHLRQLGATADMCAQKVSTALDESEYEPHTGSYLTKMRTRYAFCQRMSYILSSMQHLLELLTDNPSRIDTPMCHSFGTLLQDDLAMIASAMDCMILKIVDFNRLVTKNEILCFREAHQRFQDAVTSVREDVILNNESYETELADVYLGYFLFCVDALCGTIASFEDDEHPPSNFVHSLGFFIRDGKAIWKHTKQLFFELWHERRISRRGKESIKLALCMTLPGFFQIYVLNNESTSPLAGASVIALLYHPTGAESFHYASNRLLGTVMGSLLSLIAVELAEGRLLVLYVFIIVFSFAGAYVQAAPGFYALGNAIVCSTISVMTQYDDSSAAMDRIMQNCFAILVYFAIVSILWPMRAHTKVKMSLDTSLRCIRESCTSLLRNVDMPEDANEVSADVTALLAELHRKIASQQKFIPGAVEEPTLGSVEFPETQWWKIVEAERNLFSALNMMRSAYSIFMSQRADAETAISVHWVVLHRIAPFASDLADLIHAMMDLHLLQVQRTSIVPIAHLTRLRLAMQEANKAIIDTYITTLQRKVHGDDEMDDEEWNSVEMYSPSGLQHGRGSTSSGTPSPLSQVLPRISSPGAQNDGDAWERDAGESWGGRAEGGGGGTFGAEPSPTSPSHCKPAPNPTSVHPALPDHTYRAGDVSPLFSSMGDAQNKKMGTTSSVVDLPNTDLIAGKHPSPLRRSPLTKPNLKRLGAGSKEDHDEQGDSQSIGERSSHLSHDDGEEDTYGTAAPPRRRRGGRDMGDPSKNPSHKIAGKAKETAKKGTGYLTYKLTLEEEKELRNFLQSRRNGGDGGGEGNYSANSSSPSTFNLSFTPSIVAGTISDMRLLAASTDDQSLAEKLRKKHKIKVQRKESELQAAEETTKIMDSLCTTPVGAAVIEEGKGREKIEGKEEKKTNKLLSLKTKRGRLRRGSRKKEEGEGEANRSNENTEDMRVGDEDDSDNMEEYEGDADEDGFEITPHGEEDHDGDINENSNTVKRATGKILMSNASFISARPFLSRLLKNSKSIKYNTDELSSIALDSKKGSGSPKLPPLGSSNLTVEDESEDHCRRLSLSNLKDVSISLKEIANKSLTIFDGAEHEDEGEEKGMKQQTFSSAGRPAQQHAVEPNGVSTDGNNPSTSPATLFSPMSRSPSAFVAMQEGEESASNEGDAKGKSSGKNGVSRDSGSLAHDGLLESASHKTSETLAVTPLPSSGLGRLFTQSVATLDDDDDDGTGVVGGGVIVNQRSGSHPMNTSSASNSSRNGNTVSTASPAHHPPPAGGDGGAIAPSSGKVANEDCSASGGPERDTMTPELIYSRSDPVTVPHPFRSGNGQSLSTVTNDLRKTFSTPDKGEGSIFGNETETIQSKRGENGMAIDDELNELDFFDGARGEFVLTNSDIHSLEAFFFGTRALVVYLHDLQRAIIDMHHQYELNKKL